MTTSEDKGIGWFGRLMNRATPAPPPAPVPWDASKITVGRIEIVWRRCCNCNEPMRDGDVIVNAGATDRISTGEAHARCAVFVKTPMGVRRLDGSSVDVDVATGRIKSPPTLAFLMTPDECRVRGIDPDQKP
jgi:hypothetical protein